MVMSLSELKHVLFCIAYITTSRPGHLLIAHGTDDDNVFLQHSHILTSALTKAGKPYQLQVGGVQYNLVAIIVLLLCDKVYCT